MLSPHIADEVVELMVGYLFLHPGAAEPPTSREVAFVRFLDLIASHPWGELPLFIDPEEESTAEIMQALEKRWTVPRHRLCASGHLMMVMEMLSPNVVHLLWF